MATRNRTLAWLFVATVPAFAVTGTVTRMYRDHERALAAEWVQRADEAARSGEHERAIEALHSALRFAPGNREHTFALARSLIAAGRATEARAYLRTLWESEPGSGRVNIELGRIAAAEGNTTEAVRYYHNAIEGSWRAEADVQRRRARLELATYLVSRGERAKAQAELIPLTTDLPPERDDVVEVGQLLLDAGAAGAARDVFETGLRANRRDTALLAGAAEAAFLIEDFAAANLYFTRARAAGASVGINAEVAGEVLRLDPFQPRLSGRERARRTMVAIERAAERAADCAGIDPALREALDALRPRLTLRALQRDPTSQEDAFERAYHVEAAAVGACAQTSTPRDRALVLIGRRHFRT